MDSIEKNKILSLMHLIPFCTPLSLFFVPSLLAPFLPTFISPFLHFPSFLSPGSWGTAPSGCGPRVARSGAFCSLYLYSLAMRLVDYDSAVSTFDRKIVGLITADDATASKCNCTDYNDY